MAHGSGRDLRYPVFGFSLVKSRELISIFRMFNRSARGIIISRALDELGFGIESTVLVATSYLGIRLRHRYKRTRGQDIIKPGVHEIKEWKSWRMV